MTVEKLIETLQALNAPQAMVVVRGYESGFNEAKELRVMDCIKSDERGWYSGEYEERSLDERGEFEAVEIVGRKKQREL